jgi:hypothetical protein
MLNFSDNEQSIYYKQTILGECNYDVFQINNDGTFLYYRNMPDLTSLVDVCDTTEGKWIRKGDTIILNSNFQYKDFVKYISEFEYKDSIKIRYIKYSNYEPISNFPEIIFKNNHNSTSFEDYAFDPALYEEKNDLPKVKLESDKKDFFHLVFDRVAFILGSVFCNVACITPANCIQNTLFVFFFLIIHCPDIFNIPSAEQ